MFDNSSTTTLVILARSWKAGDLCIAGKTIVDRRPGGWVRPVSDTERHALDRAVCRTGRGDAEILDIVDVALRAAAPLAHQPENWTIGAAQWTSRGRLDPRDLDSLVDPVAPLWLPSRHPNVGRLDAITAADAAEVDSSLRLIKTTSVRFDRSIWDGKHKWRVKFHHAGHLYDLRVTDIAQCARLDREDRAVVEQGPTYLCISLGENFNGMHYRLVAGVVNEEMT